MRRSALFLALASLSACATTGPTPAAEPAKATSPAADPFAGCIARAATERGFAVQCGTRMASLEMTDQASPESVLESYYAGFRGSVTGDLRRSPVERVVGGQTRRGLSLALVLEGQTEAIWSGEALAWAEPDGTSRLVSCGARTDAERERELCGPTYEALATATGLPAGVSAPEAQQIPGWPPAMPAGCEAGPQTSAEVFHAVCPESGANLVLMRLGNPAAEPSRLSQALVALSKETHESIKASGSPQVKMESARCNFAGAASDCARYVFPTEDEISLVMLMAVGNSGSSAIVAQCFYALEMGVPAECIPWVAPAAE